MTLCDECQEAHEACLDYRLPPQLKIASGAAYDDTAAGLKDRQQARFEEWHNTINQQQALIRRICEQQHQPQ